MVTCSPKISVILCTYNRKEFLRNSIQSILNQTFNEFELILIDNGSTDGTSELCKEYSNKDQRIKWIEIKKNLGASVGRNTGLQAANCDYITIIDDDDYCYPTMLQFLWELSQTYQADIAMCGSWNKTGDKLDPYFIFEETFVFDRIEALKELLHRKKFNVAPPTKLIKKQLFENISFKENVQVDDIHVMYKVFANADIVVIKGDPLYSFTKHLGNMTHFIQKEFPPASIIVEYLQAFRERTLYMYDYVKELIPYSRYTEWSYMISMCKKIQDVKNTDDYSHVYKKMVRILEENYDELINCDYIEKQEIENLETILANKQSDYF